MQIVVAVDLASERCDGIVRQLIMMVEQRHQIMPVERVPTRLRFQQAKYAVAQVAPIFEYVVDDRKDRRAAQEVTEFWIVTSVSAIA